LAKFDNVGYGVGKFLYAVNMSIVTVLLSQWFCACIRACKNCFLFIYW